METFIVTVKKGEEVIYEGATKGKNIVVVANNPLLFVDSDAIKKLVDDGINKINITVEKIT